MTDEFISGNFLRNGRGMTFGDSGTVTWTFDATTNKLTATASVGAGGLTSANISDFVEASQDATGALLQSSTTITPTYNDAGNALTMSVNDGTITYTKIQNVSATNRILGRMSAGAGSIEELTAANVLTILGVIPAGNLPGSFNGFANPTGAVGLAAVNGSAATAMRSDGAPALSQAIAPTWSAPHIHSYVFTTGGSSGDAAIALKSALPAFALIQTGAATDAKTWLTFASNTDYVLRIENDAGSANKAVFDFVRAANVLSSMSFGNATDNNAFNFLGTGTTTFSGAVKVVGKVGFNNTAPATKPTVTGSKAANAALTSLMTALVAYGLVTDTTT